jgi:hypothetical protein
MAVTIRTRTRPDLLARLGRWDDLIRFARTHQPPIWVFRGQKQKWALRPSVGRNKGYNASRELQLFNEFRRLASPFVDSSKLSSDWDWLFAAQHHGLPTRLLDWTSNPLVAAYWACQPSPHGKRDGEIIAVRVADVGILSEQDAKESPFSIQANAFVYPSAIAPRIGAQKGLFSVHAVPNKNWILRNRTERLTITSGDKAYFLNLLYGLGVDAAMIMADLDGLAKNLCWRYETKRPIL